MSTSRFPRSPLFRAVTGAAAVATLAGGLLVSSPGSAYAAPAAAAKKHSTSDVEVIAHRGASGYRPEHTLAAYQLAIDMGADYIEPDVVSTKDGVLVARHENEISGTTDVADHPEFADRKTTKVIDGVPLTGWFTEDFTLAELKTLRAKERLPEVRPGNTRFDGRFEIPTLDEVFALVKRASKEEGRTIGVAPETKHPTYFDSIGLSLEEPLLEDLDEAGLDKKKSKVLLQSFEVDNLRDLDEMTDLPLAQLYNNTGAPYDQVEAGTGVTYASMATPEGLADVAEYADVASYHKDLVLPRNADGSLAEPTAVVDDAHEAGLDVAIWTIRDENQFMATDFRIGTDPNAKGNVRAEIHAFLDTGVDTIFSDFADTAVDAVESYEG